MLDIIVSEYGAHLQAEKGNAPATQRGYLAAVRGLLEIARTLPHRLHLPRDWRLEHLDKRALEIYLNHLRDERGWAPSTLAHQASALRSFFAFLQQRGHVRRNPARSLLPKLPPRDETPPDGDEQSVQALFESGPRTLAAAREQLLLELAYGAALRPSVLYAIRSLRVFPRAGVARIGTRGTMLDVPLSADGRGRAAAYQAYRRQATGGRRRAAFWVDERGRPCHPARLARQITRAMERVGLSGGPTALRQLAARHFAERGGDTRSVQQLLHAKRLGRLDRYAPPDYQSVLRQFRALHPRQGAGE